MTPGHNSALPPIAPTSLTKRMLRGAGLALILITAFLFMAGEPNPEWPKWWMLRPLIVVPIAGGMGGALYYFMDSFSQHGRLNKALAILLSLIGYLFILWLVTVFGLDGTLWD